MIDRDLVEWTRIDSADLSQDIKLSMRYPYGDSTLAVGRRVTSTMMLTANRNPMPEIVSDMFIDLDQYVVGPIMEWDEVGDLTP